MEEKKILTERFGNLKESIGQKFSNGKQWCCEHKAELLVVGPVLITFAADMIKTATKKSTVAEERRLKDRYVYDDKNRHYYELSRKLKSSEWLQVDHRKQDGEMLGEILQDMHVLKR